MQRLNARNPKLDVLGHRSLVRVIVVLQAAEHGASHRLELVDNRLGHLRSNGATVFCKAVLKGSENTRKGSSEHLMTIFFCGL